MNITEQIAELLEGDDTFRYMMLGRIKDDCVGYLDPLDNRYQWTERLWSHDPQKQIEIMKALYNSFPAEAKPQWLTWEQVLFYESQMVPEVPKGSE